MFATPAVGSRVKVTSQFRNYVIGMGDIREDVFEGSVLESYKNDRPGTFRMTGDGNMPIRVITLKYVTDLKIGGKVSKKVRSNTRTFKVESKGNKYIVVVSDGSYKCDCTGFSYRKTCKHSQAVKKLVEDK